MRKIISCIGIGIILLYSPLPVYAKSVRGHLFEMGDALCGIVKEPLRGAFISGPENIKKAYMYEVHQREKPEKRGLLRYRLLAFWRAPGEEAKGIVDGCVKGVESLGTMSKECISIFFSD